MAGASIREVGLSPRGGDGCATAVHRVCAPGCTLRFRVGGDG